MYYLKHNLDFKKNRSTGHVLIMLVEKITQAFERKEAKGVFLGL